MPNHVAQYASFETGQHVWFRLGHMPIPQCLIIFAQFLANLLCRKAFICTFAWKRYKLIMLDAEPGDENSVERDAYRYIVQQANGEVVRS